MNFNQTDRLVNHLMNLSSNGFTSEQLLFAKRVLLDYIGVSLAGRKLLTGKLNELESTGLFSTGDFIPIGGDTGINAMGAALVNGMQSHVADLDDGTRFGAIHPGTTAISAVLAIGNTIGITGNQILSGIILGYEASIILANSIQPEHKLRGYHTTGTCGTIGAAVGSGIVLGLNKESLKHSISAATTVASGLLGAYKDDSDLKAFNAGQAAMNGLCASYLAKAGFKGPVDSIGNRSGFLNAFAAVENLTDFEKDSPSLQMEKIYFKPFAACRHAHPAIQAVKILQNKHTFQLAQIKSIKVYTYKLGIQSHDHQVVNGIHDAKMSTPFSISLFMYNGSAGLNDFTEGNLSRPEIQNLAIKTQLVEDADISAAVPNKRGARVAIEMLNGELFVEKVDYPLGEPEAPMDDVAIETKFKELAKFYGLSEEIGNNIIHDVWNIENCYPSLFKTLTNHKRT